MASVTSVGGHAGISSAQRGGSGKNPYKVAFALVTALFFVFGFITCLNDILVPHLKSLFSLNYTQAALVQFFLFHREKSSRDWVTKKERSSVF